MSRSRDHTASQIKGPPKEEVLGKIIHVGRLFSSVSDLHRLVASSLF